MAFPAGWTKRKQITLTNNDAAAKTGQAWEVAVAYDADMRSDFGDLRFSTDGVAILAHCIVEAVASTSCRVFVTYPGTVAAGGSVNFYCYYGAAAETDASTDDVFLWRQNFAQNANVVTLAQATNQFSVGGLTPPTTPLTTPTYDGSGQSTHPSVIKFATAWNGYIYWMAMTPYPGSNDNYENPSILVSNDGISWSVPSGGTNPVVPAPSDLTNYNADPELVYNPTTDELWLYYRTSYPSTSQSTLSLKKSANGIAWGTSQVLVTWPYSADYVSPAILRLSASDWKMWGVNSTTFRVHVFTSTDGETWTTTPQSDTNIYTAWHIGVVFDAADEKYYLIKSDRKDSPHGNLIWHESADGVAWTSYDVPLVIKSGDTSELWDERLYRPSFVKSGDDLEVYYGGYTSSLVWRIGRVTGSLAAAKQIMRRMIVGTAGSGGSCSVVAGELNLASSNNLTGAAWAKSPSLCIKNMIYEFRRYRTSQRYGDSGIGRFLMGPTDTNQYHTYPFYGNGYGVQDDTRHLLVRATAATTQTVLVDNLNGPDAGQWEWTRLKYSEAGLFSVENNLGAGYSELGSVTDTTYLNIAKYVAFSQGGYSGGAYGGTSKISDVFAYPLVVAPSVSFGAEEAVGGGPYTETLDTLITSISSAADQQAYRDTVDTLITSGATTTAVQQMVEALLTLGQSASTATDAQSYLDGPATTGISSSAETDTQAYVDALADTLVSASAVTDVVGTPPISESLLTTAVSASSVTAAQAYVDTVTTLAHSSSSLAEVLGLVEQIGTVGESISAVSDRQLYYDNVAIVALSSSSLAEVGAYIEQVGVAAVSASSLTDVLVGSFVGRYVFADYCRPRSFADYCRPRGRTLQ